MKLPVPEVVGSRLAQLENSQGPFDELTLSHELDQLVPDVSLLSEGEKFGYFAEVVAWRFRPTYDEARKPWDSFFGPTWSGLDDQGQPFYNPDALKLPRAVIEHWAARAESTPHPRFKAHFGDLAWEIGTIWSKAHPNDRIPRPKELAEQTIEAYLATVASGFFSDEHHIWQSFRRALELALLIKDATCVDAVKAAAFAHARSRAPQLTAGHWWNLHHMVWNETRLKLSDAERGELMGWLQDAVTGHSDISKPETFDPNQASDAAEMLRLWHLKLKQPELAQQAIKTAAGAFEQMALKADGHTAIGWLEDVSIRLKRDGLTQDAARIDGLIRRKNAEEQAAFVPPATAATQTLAESAPFDVQHWLADMTLGSLDHTLRNIGADFMHDEAWLAKSLQDMEIQAPLLARIPISLTGADGFREAMVGSTQDDLQGRKMHLASNLMSFNSPYLHLVVEKAKEVWHLDAESLHAWLVESSIFKPREGGLLLLGLKAWEEGDHPKAVHLLVPQVEAATRECMFAWGESPMEFDKEYGGFKSMGLGKMLISDAAKKHMKPALRHHMRCLYTHPKGVNLRNRVAHGLAGEGFASMGMANWIIHTLLAIRSSEFKGIQGG